MNFSRVLRVFIGVALSFGLLLLGTACDSNTPAVSGPTPASTPVASANAVAEAEKLYAGRGEDLARVRSALVMLRSAQAEDNANYDVAWRLAKYNYYLGDNTTNEAERDKSFEDGIKAGEQAVKINAEKPEGHFWLGANYGGRARQSALQGAVAVDDIRKEMNEVIRLDEGYQGGAAYLALGQIEMELPSVMGGSSKKAIEYLEKGQKFSATNALTRYWLAKAYLDNGRKADAKAKLEEILKMTPDPDYAPEHKKVVADAEKLLKETFAGK
jgi:tetratricopeptide (TPR) repeat protein